ncbi:anaerobic ribonucleoside-triphosphate reductase activating protein [Gordonibacter sp. 28C]|uniref:anaerobic ribonucleoside-triphosphate reductase activating protein n=1 Tax=Gordonibacter sp. 28C TaxID=2078569 RepID=UPI000DF7A50D|nr:anaerobic ribonucleoside-triphosphate reductase activating protein [Gordonibacter sp. 28C]RDB61966.1 anaerobic ribonucleoside-triphosphate reductase activating protein [Gordonibacter sp. 28C]
MRIAGLQKLTLLDYPEHTAATVFLPGCNFRCPFCHNAALVLDPNDTVGDTPIDEFFALLDKRHGLLDGVCITGGEPLLQPDLVDFCTRIKREGFAVKLDTNGSFPEALRALVETELVDYVAMDVKNAPERYAETVGVPGFDAAPIRESIDYLLSGAVPYEFRTTVVRELHEPADLVALSRWIAGASAWHLQSFVDADTVLAGAGTLHAYAPAELEALLPELQQAVPNTRLRGV